MEKNPRPLDLIFAFVGELFVKKPGQLKRRGTRLLNSRAAGSIYASPPLPPHSFAPRPCACSLLRCSRFPKLARFFVLRVFFPCFGSFCSYCYFSLELVYFTLAFVSSVYFRVP